MPPDTTLDNVAEEGRRLAVVARQADLPLRLLGGVAVWCNCPSARVAPLIRPYGDADFVGRSGDRKRITGFMESEGYEADRMFNALHGASRLNFHDPARGRPIDVLLDRFVMAHELNLENSSSSDQLTISLADLLMTKLQVVSINEKDVRDLTALLLDHGFGDGGIELKRVLEAAQRLGTRAHHPREPGHAADRDRRFCPASVAARAGSLADRRARRGAQPRFQGREVEDESPGRGTGSLV